MIPTKGALRVVLFLAALATVVLAAWSALAGGGNFAVKTPEVDEKGGEWHIKVRIDLPRTPSMMHVPMRLTFTKEVVDERAIMSKGAQPEHHRMVLDTVQKQIVGMDVDFADPAGKVFKSTYFEFDLRRATGYFEAGEYTVALAGPDGDIGGAQKLTLKGDNPPVYRGAMDFASNKDSGKKKGPKMENVSSGLDGGDDNKVAQNDTPAAAPMSTDVAPSGDAPDMIPKNAFNKTAEEESVQDHPKGCGCVAAGLDRGSLLGGGAALLGLGVAIARRRRK
ncbi:MAG TPA: hypothetical protein VKU41_08810 [Polyangiaceae bacterium]|nr:hypothetical protein [Polyangiaceae bacterium]